MLLLVFVAIALGFLLIFFLTATSPQKKQIQLPSAKQKTPKYNWTEKEFEEHCIAIIKSLKLEIVNIVREKENVMEIFAENPEPLVGGRYIIHAINNPLNGVVAQDNIITLSSIVKYEGVTKGIFLTTGTFPENVEALISESSVELIDGSKLLELSSNLP